MNEGTIFCSQCGAQNTAAAQFCRQCGNRLNVASSGPAVAGTFAPPPVSQPQPAWPVPVSTPYGGFWIRVVAALIDWILVGLAALPVSLMIRAMIGVAGIAVSMPHAGIRVVNFIIGGVFEMGVAWLYEAGMESSSRQATLGKMIVGVKVTDLNGNRISFARATGRHFAKILSSVLFFAGYIMAGFTGRKQALHDMIAGTLVAKV